jgi:hypothetical protein
LIDFLISKEANIRKTLEGSYERAIELIENTRIFIQSQQFFHYIRQDSAQGYFKIAKQISFKYHNRSMCSLATDGTYIYVIPLLTLDLFWRGTLF